MTVHSTQSHYPSQTIRETAETHTLSILVTNDPVRAEDFRARIPGRAGIAGSVEQVAAAIAEYAEVGIDEFIIPDVAWADGAEHLAALDDLVDLVDRG